MTQKLVIFDLDGVLVKSREMHYKTLNAALEIHGYHRIPYEVHLAQYDGLPTSAKLDKLGIPKDIQQEVWRTKQELTLQALNYTPDKGLHELFRSLTYNGIKIAVASNARYTTIQLILSQLNLLEFVGYIASAEFSKPKPSPEMYWECMAKCGVDAQSTLIVEDSHIGREAALASGATLYPVEGPQDLNTSLLKAAYALGETKEVKWRQKNLNVVIPMAGEGSRFAAMGYTFPKPLIDIGGKPMIQLVVENLNIEAHYIFIVREDHYEKYQLKYLLNLIAPGCDIIQVKNKTEGAACTVLLAKELINNDCPLLIANSDQLVAWNSSEVLYSFQTVDAGIVTFESTHPKWSYVKLDGDGFVSEVAEKQVISNIATAGIYFWKRGSDFVRSAEFMIQMDFRINGEFYVCPTFNYLILGNVNPKIKIKQIQKMHGLGTPEDLQQYLREQEK